MGDLEARIKVPRWLLRGFSSVEKVELHRFGNASQKAYGSAVYLCVVDEEGKIISSLVMAKSRVAPAKRVTLPRLELIAASITAALLKLLQSGAFPKKNSYVRCFLENHQNLYIEKKYIKCEIR